MRSDGANLQDICRRDKVSFDTDKYVLPCFLHLAVLDVAF